MGSGCSARRHASFDDLLQTYWMEVVQRRDEFKTQQNLKNEQYTL